MKKLLFLLVNFCIMTANAQVYLISFAGTGASATVGSVRVKNLTAGTSLTLNGGNVLRLNILTGIDPVSNKQSSGLKIYPNPATGNSVLQIFPPSEGNADIKVFDMTGKEVSQMRSYLENSLQEFRFSGLRSGFYMINVTGNSYSLSGKLISNGKPSGQINIDKINNNLTSGDKASKNKGNIGAMDYIDMPYSVGDRIKFTGISGDFSTVKTDIPTGDKTITFNFISCTDGDNNSYPVVEIGSQVWMAENMKTTKYNDGTVIPLVTNDGDWITLSTPGYCWYNNDAATSKATYGAMYNWYTVSTNKLCPIGWHVPADLQWATLTTYLGGETVAGGKLKEADTTHWISPNYGATNETGFTALPGGYRYYNGVYYDIGFEGSWWNSTERSASSAWYDYMYYDITNLYISYSSFKRFGFSVRCLKD